MALFDFMKKKAPVAKQQSMPTKPETNSFGERYDRLTADGELPFGWIYRNKDFTDKIQNEYLYFCNMLHDSKSKSPKEQYNALRSYAIYIEDVEKLCKSKGECFEFWFQEILTYKGCIERTRNELEELSSNLDELQANYTKRNLLLSDLDNKIIEILSNSSGILQSDFIKLFDPLIQDDIREKLYILEKAGKLEKTKAGRSYVLHYKQ